MTPLQASIRSLREICAEFNIHTICALERSLYLADGLTQQELADKTGQTKQAIGKWESWMELNGLAVVKKTDGVKRRTITYTAAGDDFLTKITAILCPSPPK